MRSITFTELNLVSGGIETTNDMLAKLEGAGGLIYGGLIGCVVMVEALTLYCNFKGKVNPLVAALTVLGGTTGGSIVGAKIEASTDYSLDVVTDTLPIKIY